MIRTLSAVVVLVGLLCCASQQAFASDWLEPGVYPAADSEQGGETHAFGGAAPLGNLTVDAIPDIAGMASTGTGDGYLVASADGQVFAFGDAVHRGDLRAISLSAPVVDLAVTADGDGYWLVTGRGVVYAFGTALWRGSLSHLELRAPVVDLEPVSSGHGYC